MAVQRPPAPPAPEEAAQTPLSVLQVIGADLADIGGDIAFAASLSQALAQAGDRVSLVSLGAAPKASPGESASHVYPWDFASSPILSRLRLSSGVRRALPALAADHEIIHAHSLWTGPTRLAVREAARAKRPALLSLHGVLSPQALAVSRMRKAVFMPLLERRTLELATCLHATSEQEVADLRAQGLRQPVAVIPIGVDIPAAAAGEGRRREVLFLGRLHPIKGLDSLLRAWADVSPRHPGWSLRLVGPGDAAHVDRFKRDAQALGLTNVDFAGPLVGEAKAEAYARASLFVLPSRTENFGMTVVEALAAGLPVLTTKGTPWSQLEERGCGWWIDQGPAPLTAALDAALRLAPEDLAAMGERGRAWALDHFAWPQVAAQMHAVYAWMLGRASRPDFVLD